MPRDVPPLTNSQKQLLLSGIDLFNRELFYECHEALEEAWLQGAGEQKLFLQGLIQIAVALHHLRRNNLIGARRLLGAGMEKLSAFAPHHEQLDVKQLLEAAQPLLEAAQRGILLQGIPLPKIVVR
ncbi:MAG: DUF309 domain-containing protein [Acidobacteria bacterium]|nr:DUF309 domain-containing protein [Acidobacteriota bacterium]